VHYPELAGKTYRPSNGTEGMIFEETFCHHCMAYDFGAECPIYMAALVYDSGNDEYPKEWIYDQDGRPTCTAFCDRRSHEKKAPANT
jgi:hypothetical protein